MTSAPGHGPRRAGRFDRIHLDPDRIHLDPDRIHLDSDRKRPAPGVPEAGRFLE
ncbi:hypothetical protein [Streptomyces sp. NPDC024089]|uniref:hypothetical protein n=1 Tax=Streptomyces sp. NPDC024089 TaxID=3154328 RepID=UPI0033EDE606